MSDDLAIDLSEEGLVKFKINDWYEPNKILNGIIKYGAGEKTISIQQLNKLLDDSKVVGLDFYDCIPVFARGCVFASREFEMDEEMYINAENWVKNIGIPQDHDLIVWGDGEFLISQFQNLLNVICDAVGIEGEIIASFNGIPAQSGKIRISIWY